MASCESKRSSTYSEDIIMLEDSVTERSTHSRDVFTVPLKFFNSLVLVLFISVYIIFLFSVYSNIFVQPSLMKCVQTCMGS